MYLTDAEADPQDLSQEDQQDREDPIRERLSLSLSLFVILKLSNPTLGQLPLNQSIEAEVRLLQRHLGAPVFRLEILEGLRLGPHIPDTVLVSNTLQELG